MVEAVIGLCIAAMLAAFAGPVTAGALDAGRAHQAAAFLAARVREVRQQAAARGTTTGLVFDLSDGRWRFRSCADGNGNGLRRADIRTGLDPCADDEADLGELFPGVRVDVDPAAPGPDGDPPGSDPVRLGAGDMASCSASGSCSSGSVFLRSNRGAQYAVRLAGATGRLRILRYDASAGVWSSS